MNYKSSVPEPWRYKNETATMPSLMNMYGASPRDQKIKRLSETWNNLIEKELGQDIDEQELSSLSSWVIDCYEGYDVSAELTLIPNRIGQLYQAQSRHSIFTFLKPHYL